MSKMTALSKIKANTEDVDLRRFLDNAIKSFAELQARKKMRKPAIEYLKMDEKKCADSIKELKKYCLQKTEKELPEWQVLAKKNGWTPPH